MKKLLLFAVAAIIGIGTISAGPVSLNTAKSLGQKFVEANFEKTRGADLNLTYTVTSDRGDACVYVFNVGSTGFVIVSAADNVRPILGYSENGNFDSSNPYNGAMYMLETYKNSISYAIEKNVAVTPDIAAEWKSLENCGKLNNRRPLTVGPLIATRWNQNSPYNLYAPAASGGPGGRCYAGCVATAMSQVMKYWNHPLQGTGSHSYYCPGYGQQSANFGATTYDWENMPRSLSDASQVEIEAVATLMYHCGVSVNMNFDPDGSGAFSDDVPGAMSSYFGYGFCQKKSRSSFSLANWISMLKAELDLGRPMYYSGQSSSGGHAFVADGYDENDFIHFNFGWSGSDDDYYAVDAIEYASNAAAIFNFVPSAVYQNTIQAPTNVTVTKPNDMAQEATITWTNPTKTVTNTNVSSLDQIVITREGKIIYSVDNPTPGASMSFVDENVPCYSTFEYRVFAVQNGVNGVAGVATESFGPTCGWTIIASATEMQGWKGGYLVAYDAAGREIDRLTMTSNNPMTYTMNMTLGRVFFAWKAGTADTNVTIKIKDSTGAVVFQHNGSTSEIPAGVLYGGNNGCGNEAPEPFTAEIFANIEGDNIVLTWDESAKDVYGVNVYCDGLLCALVHTNEFVDEAPALGGHCYQVCYLGEGGESEMSNEVCAAVGEGCESGSNLWCSTNPSNNKPFLHWEKPENDEGLHAYYIYRKHGEFGEYERAKIVNANKQEWKETAALEDGEYMYYRVVPYYDEIDCYSAPIKARDFNQYYIKFHFNSIDDVNETTVGMNLYPNPAKDSFTVEAENMQSVTVYNTIGQVVHKQVCEGNSTVIELGNLGTGIYMVKVVTMEGESVQKVSVIK